MMKFHKFVAGFMFGVSTAASAATVTAPNRIWVSGHGTDTSGCAAPTSPCRTLQYAHDNIAAGGEIDILDPAGYGAVTITKAVSIINDGVGTAGVQATTGNAITINAGASDAVVLRGLNVEGLGTGYVGIQFNGGAALTIEHCTVRHFRNDGVNLVPSASQGTTSHQFIFKQSTINDNDGVGVYTEADANVSIQVIITHSDVSKNGGTGIFEYAYAGLSSVQIIDVSTYFNVSADVVSYGGGSSMTIGGSSMDKTPSTQSGGTINSFGDNYAPAVIGTTIAKH